ncbi:nucleoside-diphosphate kinase [Methanosalsum natronophilum]|uniref:Nucleoside diphosphate kinase n=1 Tax=Methanosalsum natronophilum TaxID=768733 RepID=A0A424Z3P3_9EURY|nr:nucleoside-diphosphate kinase [Methanosalsum natronophilum]MCS3923248.1 nucleoside-diphosphate kinase [Methanosalsum natronophilum]RQD89303.1 MAG: nucleoside-diphosphate kinase [Methanosalsum natronophilum]
MEESYVMIKPDGVQRGLVGEIISRIEKRGLKVAALRMNTISEEKAQKHYAEHENKPFFGSLISYVTSGPSVSMVVKGKNAISIMRTINGSTNPVEATPGTIRGDFAIETGRNVVHASDSKESADKEIALHFNDNEIVDYAKIDEPCLYE